MDQLEQEYLDSYSIQVLDFNQPHPPPTDTKHEEVRAAPITPAAPQKAMFVVRTLEPDRLGGGRKQVSKEYVEPSRVLVQDDPERAEEEARMLLEQQRRDKKRSKKKEYMKKKKAKQQECSKQTVFDEELLLQASHVSQ